MNIIKDRPSQRRNQISIPFFTFSTPISTSSILSHHNNNNHPHVSYFLFFFFLIVSVLHAPCEAAEPSPTPSPAPPDGAPLPCSTYDGEETACSIMGGFLSTNDSDVLDNRSRRCSFNIKHNQCVNSCGSYAVGSACNAANDGDCLASNDNQTCVEKNCTLYLDRDGCEVFTRCLWDDVDNSCVHQPPFTCHEMFEQRTCEALGLQLKDDSTSSSSSTSACVWEAEEFTCKSTAPAPPPTDVPDESQVPTSDQQLSTEPSTPPSPFTSLPPETTTTPAQPPPNPSSSEPSTNTPPSPTTDCIIYDFNELHCTLLTRGNCVYNRTTDQCVHACATYGVETCPTGMCFISSTSSSGDSCDNKPCEDFLTDAACNMYSLCEWETHDDVVPRCHVHLYTCNQMHDEDSCVALGETGGALCAWNGTENLCEETQTPTPPVADVCSQHTGNTTACLLEGGGHSCVVDRTTSACHRSCESFDSEAACTPEPRCVWYQDEEPPFSDEEDAPQDGSTIGGGFCDHLECNVFDGDAECPRYSYCSWNASDLSCQDWAPSCATWTTEADCKAFAHNSEMYFANATSASTSIHQLSACEWNATSSVCFSPPPLPRPCSVFNGDVFGCAINASCVFDSVEERCVETCSVGGGHSQSTCNEYSSSFSSGGGAVGSNIINSDVCRFNHSSNACIPLHCSMHTDPTSCTRFTIGEYPFCQWNASSQQCIDPYEEPVTPPHPPIDDIPCLNLTTELQCLEMDDVVYIPPHNDPAVCVWSALDDLCVPELLNVSHHPTPTWMQTPSATIISRTQPPPRTSTSTASSSQPTPTLSHPTQTVTVTHPTSTLSFSDSKITYRCAFADHNSFLCPMLNEGETCAFDSATGQCVASSEHPLHGEAFAGVHCHQFGLRGSTEEECTSTTSATNASSMTVDGRPNSVKCSWISTVMLPVQQLPPLNDVSRCVNTGCSRNPTEASCVADPMNFNKCYWSSGLRLCFADPCKQFSAAVHAESCWNTTGCYFDYSSYQCNVASSCLDQSSTNATACSTTFAESPSLGCTWGSSSTSNVHRPTSTPSYDQCHAARCWQSPLYPNAKHLCLKDPLCSFRLAAAGDHHHPQKPREHGHNSLCFNPDCGRHDKNATSCDVDFYCYFMEHKQGKEEQGKEEVDKSVGNSTENDDQVSVPTSTPERKGICVASLCVVHTTKSSCEEYHSFPCVWTQQGTCREHCGEEGDCGVHDVTRSPPPPTEATALEEATDVAQTTAVAVTTTTSFLSGPSAVVGINKIAAALEIARCSFAHDEKLPRLISPTQMKIGNPHGQYYRGAVVGNLALFFCIAFIIFLVTVLIAVVRHYFGSGKEETELRQRLGKAPKPFSTTWKRTSQDAHFPSVLLIPASVGFQGTVSVSVSIFIHATDKRDMAAGAVGLLVTAMIPVLCLWVAANVRENCRLKKRKQIATENVLEKTYLRWMVSDAHWVAKNKMGRVFKRTTYFVFSDFRLPSFVAIDFILLLIIGVADGVRISNTTLCTALVFVPFFTAAVSVYVLVQRNASMIQSQRWLLIALSATTMILCGVAAGSLAMNNETLAKTVDFLGLVLFGLLVLKSIVDLCLFVGWANLNRQDLKKSLMSTNGKRFSLDTAKYEMLLEQGLLDGGLDDDATEEEDDDDEDDDEELVRTDKVNQPTDDCNAKQLPRITFKEDIDTDVVPAFSAHPSPPLDDHDRHSVLDVNSAQLHHSLASGSVADEFSDTSSSSSNSDGSHDSMLFEAEEDGPFLSPEEQTEAIWAEVDTAAHEREEEERRKRQEQMRLREENWARIEAAKQKVKEEEEARAIAERAAAKEKRRKQQEVENLDEAIEAILNSAPPTPSAPTSRRNTAAATSRRRGGAQQVGGDSLMVVQQPSVSPSAAAETATLGGGLPRRLGTVTSGHHSKPSTQQQMAAGGRSSASFGEFRSSRNPASRTWRSQRFQNHSSSPVASNSTASISSPSSPPSIRFGEQFL